MNLTPEQTKIADEVARRAGYESFEDYMEWQAIGLPLPPVPEIEAFYQVAKPTFWQQLGFGERMAQFSDEELAREGYAPGYFRTDLRIRMSKLDRLRALISGKMFVSLVIRTDVEVREAFTKAETSVRAP